MKRLAIVVVTVGFAACSGSGSGPAGSTSSGGGGVVGRGVVTETAPGGMLMGARATGVDAGADS
ncbi:MAG: hypothetical protein ACXVDD_13040, partial [Polyangia bacterium]